jgi:hypothetical protein
MKTKTNLRERGLRLQRRVTVAVVAGAAVLAAVFAGIAAATSHGQTTGEPVVGGSDDSFQPSEPSTTTSSVTPAAPVEVPSQTSQPPVASSGGS